MSETYQVFLDAVERALAEFPSLRCESEHPVTEAETAPPMEGVIPQPLRSAMRYSLLLPGKRLRPVLLLAAYSLCDAHWQDALPYACALEMIHTYSLIHDDLPAMDDDSLRRGKPANHIVYGENMAILAGDGLLNLAYETMLCAPVNQRQPERAVRAAAEIARRAGVTGMIAGQTLDVKLEGTMPNAELVAYIHRHKTADLLTAPMTAGLLLAGAAEQQVQAGREYGQQLGLAFQIVDDLLDVTGDAATLGKQTGMDAQRGKMTWPAVHGVNASREDARIAVERAFKAMAVFGPEADFLRELAQETLVRTH